MSTNLNWAAGGWKLALLVGQTILLASLAAPAYAQGPSYESPPGQKRQPGPRMQFAGQPQLDARQQADSQPGNRAPANVKNTQQPSDSEWLNRWMQGGQSLPRTADNSPRGPASSFSRPQGRGPDSGDPKTSRPLRGGPRFDDTTGGRPDAKPIGDAQNGPPRMIQPRARKREFLVEITDENFRTEVLKSRKPVLVDIWAPWCGPCLAIGPMIDEVAEENAGWLKVGKLNLDECPEVAKAFNIQGLPTLLIFKDGEIIDSILGAPEKEKLQAALDAIEP